MEPEEKTTRKPWHDPKELKDRLNQPKVTLEQARAQAQRMMSHPGNATPALPAKKQV